MGQAKITGISNAGNGQYDIQIEKHPGLSVARLSVITKRLVVIAPLITQAEAAVTAKNGLLDAAIVKLDLAISQMKPGGKPAPVVAVPDWINDGNGTVTGCQVEANTAIGNYGMSCWEVVESPPMARFIVRNTVMDIIGEAYTGTSFSCAEISFKINMGSVLYGTGDSFDIDITEANINPNVDVTVAQKAVIEAIKAVSLARLKLSGLAHEKSQLQTAYATLNAAMTVETRTGVWCVDKTTTLALNQIVGTIELGGEETTILITAGGAVNKSLGKLQHVGVSTPSACFFNTALKSAWIKWKPISRKGKIITMYYDTGLCDVAVEGGPTINQSGEDYKVLQTAVSGWADFVYRNPTFPLATPGDSKIDSSQILLNDLASVNAEVNSRSNYKKDTETYGKLEYWAVMQPGGSGDCEDYALTKAKLLLDKGYPSSALHIEVGTFKTGQGHAWLIVQTSAGDIALDINFSTPVAPEKMSYVNRQRQYGTDWKVGGVLLRGVQIDYMNGINEAVFRENDFVVVEFTGQNWAAPKVIGPLTDPSCPEALLYFGPATSPFTGYSRSSITERLWHYCKSAPIGRLTALTNANVKLLILAWPNRMLTDAEKTSIATFTGRGGRVVVFNGNNYDATNAVLQQLGSKLFVAGSGAADNETLFTLSGLFHNDQPSAPTSGTPSYGNSGAGTVTAVAASQTAKGGTYTITAISSTTFTVRGPGGALPVAAIGANANAEIGFTITQGSPAIVSGDYWTIAVTLHNLDEVLRLPGISRGWITVRETAWKTSYLRDVEGVGLRYNNVTNMLPVFIYVNPSNTALRWPYIYCHEIYDELNTASPAPSTLDHWEAVTAAYPAGFVPAYNAPRDEVKAWLLANLGKLPCGKISAYGTYPSLVGYYFGSYFDFTTTHSRFDFEYFGARIAYAEGEPIVLCAMKPAWLHGDVGFTAATLDQYTETNKFMAWLRIGDRATRDLLGQGASYATLPPSQPHWNASYGIPYVPPVQE